MEKYEILSLLERWGNAKVKPFYLRILKLPMMGSFFIFPFKALMMPMTAKAMTPHETRPYKPLNKPRMMLSHKAPTAAMMTLLKVIRSDRATEMMHRTRPWLAWNLTKGDFLAPKMGASTRMPR